MLEVPQPFKNHNGGHLLFGPDGYLYIGLGDGGSRGDPHGNGQNRKTLLGSILRIDVSATDSEHPYGIPVDNPFIKNKDARDEIWSYGFRNVWRFSFDAKTGDIILADVGQHLWEEINFELSNSKGGKNYGWNIFEGNHCYPEESECVNSGYDTPIFEYPNNANYARTLLGFKQKSPDMDGCSITGGYIYRGTRIKSLYGRYIFGDYCTGKIWSFKKIGDEITDFKDHTNELLNSINKKRFYLSSFGELANGELLLIDYSGSIYKLENK